MPFSRFPDDGPLALRRPSERQAVLPDALRRQTAHVVRHSHDALISTDAVLLQSAEAVTRARELLARRVAVPRD